MREHWGLGSRALADLFMPSADAGERDAFVDFQRQAESPDQAARALEAVSEGRTIEVPVARVRPVKPARREKEESTRDVRLPRSRTPFGRIALPLRPRGRKRRLLNTHRLAM